MKGRPHFGIFMCVCFLLNNYFYLAFMKSLIQLLVELIKLNNSKRLPFSDSLSSLVYKSWVKCMQSDSCGIGHYQTTLLVQLCYKISSNNDGG